MSGHRRVLQLVLASTLLGVVAPVGRAGADEGEPPPAPVRCQKVGIIGGSITVGSVTTQSQELVELGITDFKIDGKVGRRITPVKTGGITTLKLMRKRGYDPDCLVISLGTNDIPYKNSPTIYQNWIKAMMDAIGPTPRVLWVNVYRGFSRVRDITFNEELEKMKAAYPNLQTADWFSLIDVNRTWLYRDGVHPNSKGHRERSKWLAMEIHEKLNGGGIPDGPPASDCSISVVPLQRRARNADTLCLERRLKLLRYFSKTPNTWFEYSTTTAVSNWQKRHGLPGTGIVDDATRAALGLAPPPPPIPAAVPGGG